jgi:hypothetical protein
MRQEEVTRKLIQVVLEQGLKFGIDVAGGFLGPAWPFVKPFVEKLLNDLPKDVSGRYKSSQEAVDQAVAKLEKEEAALQQIQAALAAHGVTPEWTARILEQLDRLSDDMYQVLAEQSRQRGTLEQILAHAERLAEKRPGKLVLRGERLEYVDYLRVPDDFLPGWDLAPGSAVHASFAGRHMPAGFFIWNFMLLNDGQQLVTVSSMEVEVQAEHPYPPGSELGGVLPMLEPYEDEIRLVPGQARHPLFRGKYFKYAPDTDVDAFRIRAIFQSDAELSQQVRLVIRWSDPTGEHVTYGSSLFLASLEKPQLGVSSSKLGFGGDA